MFDKSLFRSLAVLVALLLLVSTVQAVTIGTVPVGDAQNNPDDEVMSQDGTTGYGSVNYTYRIGKYEVTNAEYAAMLNAVAAVGDANGLYSTSMGGSLDGGIARTGLGTAGDPWVYSPQANRADRPVNYVSWYDSLRFANWLHNGQPSGGQGPSTTEDGAYDMSLGYGVIRRPNAVVFLPNENEWYKAAYYKGGGSSAGYWDYPTQSNMGPTAEAPPGTDMINGSANYYNGGYVDPTYYTTEVGAYDAKPSNSAYRTFDQGGNVGEWNETPISSVRGLRGGSFGGSLDYLHASFRYFSGPTEEARSVGFRVASIPEPSTAVLGMVGLLCVLWWRRAIA